MRQPGQSELADQPGSADPQPVRLVDDQQRVVPLAHRRQRRQRRLVAEHGVDRLDQHQRTGVSRRGQRSTDRGHVVVRHDLDVRLREAYGVDQRRVHVRVRDDERVTTAQRGDSGEVGVVTGREHEGGRLPEVRRELALELRVQLQRPRDQSGGSGAGSPAPRRCGGSLDDRGVTGEAEVVVPGQVRGHALRRPGSQRPLQPGRVACGRLGRQPLLPTGHATATVLSIAAQMRATSTSEVTYGGIA